MEVESIDELIEHCEETDAMIARTNRTIDVLKECACNGGAALVVGSLLGFIVQDQGDVFGVINPMPVYLGALSLLTAGQMAIFNYIPEGRMVGDKEWSEEAKQDSFMRNLVSYGAAVVGLSFGYIV